MSDPQPMISLEDITRPAVEARVEEFLAKWSASFEKSLLMSHQFSAEVRRLVALALISGAYFDPDGEGSDE